MVCGIDYKRYLESHRHPDLNLPNLQVLDDNKLKL